MTSLQERICAKSWPELYAQVFAAKTTKERPQALFPCKPESSKQFWGKQYL